MFIAEFLSKYSLTEIEFFYFTLCVLIPLVLMGLLSYFSKPDEIGRVMIGGVASIIIAMMFLQSFVNYGIKNLIQESTYIQIVPINKNSYSVFVKNDKFSEKIIGSLKFESNDEKWLKIGEVKCNQSIENCINEIKIHEKEIAANRSLETVVVKN